MIQLRFAALEYTPTGALTIFPDGASWGAEPHPDMPHYQHLAYAYGHEGDTRAYCRLHELAHHVVAEQFGSHSLVLFALAHGEQPTPMIAAAEEALAMAPHRFVMTREPPLVDGLDWHAARERVLELLSSDERTDQ